MAGIIRQMLSGQTKLLTLFLCGCLGMAGLTYLMIWVLYPEHTVAGRIFFATLVFLVVFIGGIVQCATLYRRNKSNSAEAKRQNP
jgi:uncharacterized membrane protein YqjE